MAFVLFSIFISFLTSLGVSAVLLRLFIRERLVSLPLAVSVAQASLVSHARLLVDLASNFFYLYLLYALLPSAWSLVSSLFLHLLQSFVFVIFGDVFQNLVTVSELLQGQLATFSPLDIKENVKESWDILTGSVKNGLLYVDWEEVFQGPFYQPQQSFNECASFCRGFFSSGLGHRETLSSLNLTMSDRTQQYVDTINVAAVSFLENAQVENVLNATRVPSNLYASLQEVTKALHLCAKELNFTTILRDGTVPSTTQDHLNHLGNSLLIAGISTDQKELYRTAVWLPATELNMAPTEKDQLLSLLRNPFDFIMAAKNPNMDWTWRKLTSVFMTSAWQHVLLVIFIMFVVVPLVFFSRAAVQDGCVWLVTRLYKSVIPSAQRSVSGWMFVAAISGLTLGVTEAFPLCCIFFYIHFSSNRINQWFIVFLIFHALKGAPLRTAAHMRVAEGIARKDILKERESGSRKAVIVAAVFNGAFAMWWLLSSAVFLLLPLTGFLSVITILADIVLVGFSITWGRRIHRRMVEKEQQRNEEQDRKED